MLIKIQNNSEALDLIFFLEGRPIDCNDIPDKCPSGVYKVFPKHTQGIDVYCEMVLDEGHWTVTILENSKTNKHYDRIKSFQEFKCYSMQLIFYFPH